MEEWYQPEPISGLFRKILILFYCSSPELLFITGVNVHHQTPSSSDLCCRSPPSFSNSEIFIKFFGILCVVPALQSHVARIFVAVQLFLVKIPATNPHTPVVLQSFVVTNWHLAASSLSFGKLFPALFCLQEKTQLLFSCFYLL